MVENNQNGMCKIHNIRFYNLSPRSINYLAYNRNLCKLAVSRMDATIEIWDMRHAVHMEKAILGLPQYSVEALAWVGNRLFSTGHTGELTEWDLHTLTIKQSVLLTGSASWCMDVNRDEDLIAVGTEEGYLNIYQVDDSGLNYVKIFDKQEGRILCCKFDHSGDILATGSVDNIRIWDVKTGHALHRMACGRTESKKETIVWSLAVLKDLTVISGDSRGRITVWDGKLGVQVESFPVLKADVLAVAVNEEETMFCCSGIDPIIKIFQLTPVKKDNQLTYKWIKFIQRTVHDHDIKALQFSGAKVFSGGIDGYLGVSYSKKSKQILSKYGPFMTQPCAMVAESKRMLLLKYFNYLEIWRLGTPTENVQLSDDDMDKSKHLTLEEGLEKVVELRSKSDAPIVCTAISPDSSLLVYSSECSIRLFRLDLENSKSPSISRVKDLPPQFSPALHALFSPNTDTLFLAKRDGSIDVFNIADDGEIDFSETIDTSKAIKSTIIHLVVSKCGRYLVCAGSCCNITVFKSSKKSGAWKHHINLPKYNLPPTAIALHQKSPLLVAAFSDSKIFEYHLEELRFTCSSNKSFVENSATHAVKNIVLDPRNENIIMLHNDTYLFVLEKSSSFKGPKAPRTDTDLSSGDEVADFKLKSTKHYEHFVHFSWLSNGELVAVGVNPVTIIEQLVPAMRQKKFGAS